MSPRVDERFVAANGLRHHVLCRDGDPARTVVVLHGYLDLARSFAPLIDALGDDGHRVFAPDFRGHGDQGMFRRPLQQRDKSIDLAGRPLVRCRWVRALLNMRIDQDRERLRHTVKDE